MHRKSQTARFFALGVQLLLAVSRAYAERTPCIQPVTFSGYGVVDIADLSGNGQVAVGCMVGPNTQAFAWANGSFEILGGFWVPQAFANATNQNGSIRVGAVTFNGATQPVMWGPNGYHVTLNYFFDAPLGAACYSSANDISADGSVTAGTAQNCHYVTRAIRWTPTSSEDLGLIAGGTFSSATAVSADGTTIVGAANNAPSAGGRVFRWTRTTGMQLISELPGTQSSTAAAVNGDGSAITGTRETTSGNFAFRWTAIDGMQSLGVLAGFAESHGLAISGDGQAIVGCCQSSSGHVANGAFVWTPQAGIQRLSTVLLAKGADLTGWDLISATTISTDGSVVAGSGSFNGQNAAFIVRGLFPASCPSDLDGDGAVNSGDLAMLLLEFGAADPCSPDLDESGYVDPGDLAMMLLDFGACP